MSALLTEVNGQSTPFRCGEGFEPSADSPRQKRAQRQADSPPMDDESRLSEALQRIAEHADGEGEAEDLLTWADVQAARQHACSSVGRAATADASGAWSSVSPAAVARGLGMLMRQPSSQCMAAALYSALLSSPGAPVSTAWACKACMSTYCTSHVTACKALQKKEFHMLLRIVLVLLQFLLQLDL